MNIIFKKVDWLLIVFVLPIMLSGLLTIYNFGESSTFITKQIIALFLGLIVFFIASNIDLQVLKRTNSIFYIYVLFLFVLVILFVLGKVTNGARSWFSFGGFSFQPSDFVKIILIGILAKYFSRRHIEIKRFRHIVVSAIYMFIPFILVFFQPDFGSAIIIFFIWIGMTIFSGLSKKHIGILFFLGALTFGLLWGFVFKEYQKDRVRNFINPTLDIKGAGYNARQAVIAVGSGQFLGKGIGYGTQSRLNYLPEYRTDFIFAAFAEEWGFIGVVFLVLFYMVLLFRIGYISLHGMTNFETLLALGIGIFFLSHILVNIGMNIGIMPITGITLPFMSYGGSHIVTEFFALGILSSIYINRRTTHRDNLNYEFLGLE